MFSWRWRDQSSAHRFLHERADPCLFGGSQLLQREADGPHATFVEVRLVAEAERRVPGFELLRALEEADDLVVLGICGHSVPESRRESWRACFDDSMEPLAHGAIRFFHGGDLCEHGGFPIRLGRLQLLDALLHRASFLVRESLELPADRGGALGGLLRFLLWAHRNILILIWVETSPRFTNAILVQATGAASFQPLLDRTPRRQAHHTQDHGQSNSRARLSNVPPTRLLHDGRADLWVE